MISSRPFTVTEYYGMPSLYDFDDYDRCLQEFNHLSVYCFVRADVLPEPRLEAWQAIRDISQYYKHHFDHGHLYYGICVEWCQMQIDALTQEEADDLFKGILVNNSKVSIRKNVKVKQFQWDKRTEVYDKNQDKFPFAKNYFVWSGHL